MTYLLPIIIARVLNIMIFTGLGRDDAGSRPVSTRLAYLLLDKLTRARSRMEEFRPDSIR